MPWPRTAEAALFALCLASCGASTARAQPPRDRAPTIRVERPPAGSWRRGFVSMPTVGVIAFGSAIVAASAVALARRARRARA